MADANTMFEENVATELDKALRVQAANPSAWRDLQIQGIPWNQGGGFAQRALDLATLGSAVDTQIGGFEIMYVAEGSTAGGVLILNEQVVLYPGMRARGYFENLKVRRGNASDGTALTSVTIGTALLVIQKAPNLEYREGSPPGLASTAVLLDKTLLDTDLTTNPWIGADGVTSASNLTVVAFDGRPYRSIEVILQASSLAGGAAPTVTPVLNWYNPLNRLADESAFGNYQSFQVTAGGSPLSAQLVTGITAVGANLSRACAYTDVKPEFFKLQLSSTGGPTGWTPANGAKLYVVGRRF